MSKSTTTKNLKSTNAGGKGKILFLLLAIISVLFLLRLKKGMSTSYAANELWAVRSIDTMKSSRDMARSGMSDELIEKEVKLVKELGANYIAIDTPYNSEFLPYLKRWVNFSRSSGLKVWYRGSFAEYEGWFGYPKKMTPQELLTKTKEFILANKELFEDGDIFDPCPECENAGYWKQPQGDDSYNQFMKDKNDVLRRSFSDIGKNVIYNWNSVIGGRAKDVVKKDTFENLGKVIAIDHYATPANNYNDYVNYFSQNFDTKVVFSEFGAPIPDIHGKMTEESQAAFVREVLMQLYKNKEHVTGLNYWVLSGGTTALFGNNYQPKKVVSVIKDFYIPGVIRGNVKNTLGFPVRDVMVTSMDGFNSTHTDRNGNFQLVVPAGEVRFEVGDENYEKQSKTITLVQGEHNDSEFILTPVKRDFFYELRLQIKKAFVL